jgi:ribosomal protein S18 acetylase RimI-like enzyme
MIALAGHGGTSSEAQQAMTITVRQATVTDAELISALNADVQAIHASALPGRFKPPAPESFPTAEAAALLANSDNLVFLADVHREAAGYAYSEVVRRTETSLTYAYEAIYLHHISVRPEYRRQGVGSALLRTVRASGHGLGIKLLILDVWSFNEDARAFFQRHGFSPYFERLCLGDPV